MGPTDDSQVDLESTKAEAAPEPQPTPSPTPAATATPEPTPAPTATPEPTPDPAIASTFTIPASVEPVEEGGEWDLLQQKFQQWANTQQLTAVWEQSKLPLKLFGGLIAIVVVLQVYGGLIRTIEALPLAPGLLELAGLVWVANFSLRNLVKSSERQKIVRDLQDRWNRVVGG